MIATRAGQAQMPRPAEAAHGRKRQVARVTSSRGLAAPERSPSNQGVPSGSRTARPKHGGMKSMPALGARPPDRGLCGVKSAEHVARHGLRHPTPHNSALNITHVMWSYT